MSRSRLLLSAVLVFLLALAGYNYTLGNRPFYTRGEAREAIVVNEMLEQGDLIQPFDTSEEITSIFTKPPMFHWMAVLASKAFRVSEHSIRFPSALAAALALALMFGFAARAAGVATGALCILILAGTLEWNRSAGHARVDMVFTFGVTLSAVALYTLIEYWRATGAVHRGWLLCFSIACAFSVLSKGPFGLLFPWAVGAVYLCLLYRSSLAALLRRLPWAHLTIALLGSIALSSVWYLLAYRQGGHDFVKVHLLEENLGRFMNVAGDTPEHSKPLYYSVVYLFTSFFPFSLFLPVLCFWLWRQRSLLLAGKNPVLLYALVWFGLLFAAVTISTSKREVYLLPGFPALAFLLSLALRDAAGRPAAVLLRRIIEVPIIVIAGILGLGGVAAAVVTWVGGEALLLPLLSEEARAVAPALLALLKDVPLAVPGMLFAAALLAAAARSCRRDLYTSGSVKLAAAVITVVTIVNTVVLPVVAAASSPAAFVAKMNELVPADAPVVQYKHTFFPAMYYVDRQVDRDIPTVLTLDQLPHALAGYVLVRKDSLEEVLNRLENESVVLVSNNKSANGDDQLVLIEYRL